MFDDAVDKPAKRALELVARWSGSGKFYLAGGTAAAIQLGHRVSVDLDFFSPVNFEAEEVARDLMAHGIKTSQLQYSPGTLHFLLERCAVSFFFYNYPLLSPTLNY